MPRTATNGGFALVIGLTLFFGTTLQQAGIETTSATNAGFLTACYVVLTPFVVWALTGARPRVIIVGAGFVSLVGAWLLASGGGARSSEHRRRARAPRRFRLGDGHRADADLPCPLRPAAAARLRAIYGLRRPRGAVFGPVRIDCRRERSSRPCRRSCSPALFRARSPIRSRSSRRRIRRPPRRRSSSPLKACSLRSRARSCSASV